jgi:putative oxidoreductase
MNAFLSLGRWFFIIPFALFGTLHFLNAQSMAEQVVPNYLPAKTVWVYLAGAGMIGASICMLSEKYDKLAATLLSIMLLGFVFLIHLPNATAGNQFALPSLLKDMALAGAAMMYAQKWATDRSFIG